MVSHRLQINTKRAACCIGDRCNKSPCNASKGDYGVMNSNATRR